MRNGYIYLLRKMTDNEMWLSEKFTKSQAWIDMLFMANFKDSMFFLRGVEIRVKRGQIAWSEEKIAKRWKWSRGKVRRFLVWLSDKTRQQIVQHKSSVLNIIEIVNYEEYQTTVQQTVQETDNRQYKKRTHIIKTNKDLIKNNKTTKDSSNGKKDYSEFVKLKEKEHEKLVEKFGEDGTKERIEELSDAIGSKGYKYNSHYHTILNWSRRKDKKKTDKYSGMKAFLKGGDNG